MSALGGKRVLLTRPRERSEELVFLLEDEGAEVIALPLLELLPPEDPRPLRSAAEGVQRYAWVLFASPSAVQAFCEAVRLAGTSAMLAKVRIGAVGERTAKVAQNHGLTVEVVAPVATGAGLAEAIAGKFAPGDEILLPCAEEGRRELGDALTEQGAVVSRVAAYRSAPTAIEPSLIEAILEAPPDVTVFGSPRTVHAFLDTVGERARSLLGRTRVVAIGPTTAAALEVEGIFAQAVARAPSPAGLVEAALAAVSG